MEATIGAPGMITTSATPPMEQCLVTPQGQSAEIDVVLHSTIPTGKKQGKFGHRSTTMGNVPRAQLPTIPAYLNW